MVISSIADRKFLLSKLWNRRSNHCSHNSIAVNKCIGRALPLEPRISNTHESYITSIYIFISMNADKFYVFFFSIKIIGFIVFIDSLGFLKFQRHYKFTRQTLSKDSHLNVADNYWQIFEISLFSKRLPRCM